MINLFFIGLLIVALHSAESYAETYTYKYGFKIEAPTYNQAAKKCFALLSKGGYISDELSLTYIDICVNPVKGKIN